MGLLDGIKMGIGVGRQAAASVPKWARIVRIEPTVGRFARITLEIHYGRTPPFEHTTLQRIPRGVTAEPGQDVAIRQWVSEDPHDLSYSYWISWHRPPQYGLARGELLEKEHPVGQFMDAQRARRDGRLSDAEFERARQSLRGWVRRKPPPGASG